MQVPVSLAHLNEVTKGKITTLRQRLRDRNVLMIRKQQRAGYLSQLFTIPKRTDPLLSRPVAKSFMEPYERLLGIQVNALRRKSCDCSFCGDIGTQQKHLQVFVDDGTNLPIKQRPLLLIDRRMEPKNPRSPTSPKGKASPLRQMKTRPTVRLRMDRIDTEPDTPQSPRFQPLTATSQAPASLFRASSTSKHISLPLNRLSKKGPTQNASIFRIITPRSGGSVQNYISAFNSQQFSARFNNHAKTESLHQAREIVTTRSTVKRIMHTKSHSQYYMYQTKII